MIKKDLINLDLINSSLKDNGYVKIKNFFTQDTINKIYDFTVSEIKRINKDRFSINESQLENTVINNIIYEADLKKFCEDLNEKNAINNVSFNPHFLIHYKRKKNKSDEKFSFHYDAFVYTIIIPINIHNENENNFAMSLELIPNYRNLTNSMIINIFQKLIIQNKLFKFFSNSFLFKFFFKTKNIKIDFSEILIFNGFRSLHSHSISKAHVEKEKARLIIHVFNPFHDNKINQLIFENIQKKRVIKN